MHTHALARDVLWSCDESFLGRDTQGEVRGLLVRETRVPLTLDVAVGPPATGDDIARALERAAEERGSWPLVVAFDNGKANKSKVVLRLLAEHQVLALFNLPYTPQHNAPVERGWCDLKLAAGLDEASTRAADTSQVHVCASIVAAADLGTLLR